MSVPASRASLDQSDLEDIIQLVLDEAGRQGADQAEAAASHDYGLSATARLGHIENLEYTNDRGVGVTVYHDSKKGSASTSDFSDGALREAVTKASTFAKLATMYSEPVRRNPFGKRLCGWAAALLVAHVE